VTSCPVSTDGVFECPLNQLDIFVHEMRFSKIIVRRFMNLPKQM